MDDEARVRLVSLGATEEEAEQVIAAVRASAEAFRLRQSIDPIGLLVGQLKEQKKAHAAMLDFYPLSSEELLAEYRSELR
jgi:hypothetical protein